MSHSEGVRVVREERNFLGRILILDMEEKLICCCGSSGWTRVIAWFHIIGAVYAVFSIFYTGEIVVLPVDVKDTQHSHVTPAPPGGIPVYDLGGISHVDFFILLLLAALVFVMGIVLLLGSHNGNPRQIYYWTVYIVMFTSVWVVKEIIEIFRLGKKIEERNFAIFGIVGISAIQGFSLWVVLTHKKEMEASPVVPLPPPSPVKIYPNNQGEP